jgi:putative transposase
MRKNFTSEQMLYTVRQAESGTPVAEVCRKLGITEQTFYKWKRRVAGMGIAELTRLRQLEDENKKLKALVAGRSRACHKRSRWTTAASLSPRRSMPGPIGTA